MLFLVASSEASGAAELEACISEHRTIRDIETSGQPGGTTPLQDWRPAKLAMRPIMRVSSQGIKLATAVAIHTKRICKPRSPFLQSFYKSAITFAGPNLRIYL